MDDCQKCLVYEYLSRMIVDEENSLRELNNCFLDKSFPIGSDDYISYAIALSRKTLLHEVFGGVCTILSSDSPS